MNMKKTFANKRFKRGSYSSILTLVVIVVVVAANLLIAELPAKYTELDVSGTSLYEISDRTKALLSDLEEDITIYLVAQSGGEDRIIEELLERYQELSGHIRVEHRDPVDNPSFITKYTDETVYENSLVVESEKRFKIVSYYEIYQSYYAGQDANGEAVYSQTFAGEGQLTSAIGFVVTDNLPTFYTLSGHEEWPLPDSLISSITHENIALEELDLMTQNAIPENCNGIFLVGPQRDLTNEELATLQNYMEQGGRLFLITNYTGEAMPNLQALAASYGLEVKEGIVLEGDANHYSQQNDYLIPEYINHEITAPIKNGKVHCLAIAAQALAEIEGVKNVEIEYLLQTSEKAFNKATIMDESSRIQTEEDEKGPFYLGAASTKNAGKPEESAMVLLTTASFIDDSTNTYIAGGNYDLVINAMSWLCEHEEAITIHSKKMSTDYVALNAGQVMTWSIILIAAIPLICLVLGVVIWIIRRRR